MSPEYAMEGVFSTKSDVYSFGVLLFEIVSGKRNNSFYTDERQLNLVGHVRLSNLLYCFNTLFLLLYWIGKLTWKIITIVDMGAMERR